MCSNVRGVRWHPAFTDLIPADGGKAVGMQVMLEHFGWTKDNAIAFGDGGNDVDMLRFAGIGVAMGNATDEPKAAADYVTDSVDDAGIANAFPQDYLRFTSLFFAYSCGFRALYK